MDRRAATAMVMVSVVGLVACGGPPGVVESGPAYSSSSTCTARVTPDCSAYTYSNPSPGTVVVTAPRSSGGDNREFFWSTSGGSDADTVCATFASGGGIDQQGVVIRLHAAAHGGVTGISVTRNIWMDAFDVFNFHVWNTGADPGNPFTMFGSKVLSELPVRPAVYPLNMCVRVVGRTDDVQFVVWTKGQHKPGWGSTTEGGEARIPAGAPTTGRAGWFAGHLSPGTSMTYGNLSIDGTVATGLP